MISNLYGNTNNNLYKINNHTESINPSVNKFQNNMSVNSLKSINICDSSNQNNSV
jgi:hypothetical protein